MINFLYEQLLALYPSWIMRENYFQLGVYFWFFGEGNHFVQWLTHLM